MSTTKLVLNFITLGICGFVVLNLLLVAFTEKSYYGLFAVAAICLVIWSFFDSIGELYSHYFGAKK